VVNLKDCLQFLNSTKR